MSGDAGDASKGGAKKMAGWKKVLLLIVIFAAAVGIAYGVGRLQGALELAPVEEELQAERVRGDLLEARWKLEMALTAMNADNFGIAQGHVDQAAERLRATSADDEAATPLAEELEAVELSAGSDPQAQKDRIRGLAERLDSVLSAGGS